jgi:hypothetical protein
MPFSDFLAICSCQKTNLEAAKPFRENGRRSEAVNAYQQLERISFRTAVYRISGYTPGQMRLERWKYFHDRIDVT